MNVKAIGTLRNFLIPVFLLLLPLAVAGTSLVTPHGDLAHASTVQAAAPVPYFLVTWSASAVGDSDSTNYGTRSVKHREISYAGSTVIRQLASGGQDNYPLDLTVNDDFEQVDTASCDPGTSRYETKWSIVDPARYKGGPTYGAIAIPLQRADGSWFMADPVKGLMADRMFHYNLSSDDVHCGGDRDVDSLVTELGNYVTIFLPGAGDLQGDASGKVFTKVTQFDVIGEPPMTVQWTVTARRLEGRDLTVDHLEVTQGLQDEANTVPLIRGRRTVVRAYIHTGTDPGPVAGVTGKLTAYNGSTAMGSVNPFNPAGKIAAQDWPDWHNIDDTLNFELPYSWTLQPALRLVVEVNPAHNIVEINYNNNTLEAPFETLASDGIKIGYTPIGYVPPGGFNPENPSANIARGQEFLRKIYPIPDKQLNYYPLGKIYERADVNAAGEGVSLLRSLNDLILVSSATRPDSIFGWLPSAAYNDNGLGFLPGTAGFGNDTESPDRWRRTLAHEIGHNEGLDHSGLTTAGAHWFDVYDRAIKSVPASVGGADLLDVMQPARLEPEAWISIENYTYLITKMASFGGAALSSVQPAAVSDNLLISGIITNATPASGSLSPMLRLSAVPTYILPEGAQYCVTLKNESTVLSQYCFNEDFSNDSSTLASSMPFGMVVPYPADLNRVELSQGASILSTFVPSAHPPTVTVTFPSTAGLTLSGQQNITWTGSDSDGNPLTYTVLYSRDNGVTWIGIGAGITASTYSVNFSSMPGTNGASGRIKVMASDGFYSAEDISDNGFSVGSKPPNAAIISPPNGTSFAPGTYAVIEGIGVDLEDGSLSDSALSWTSNVDGSLGTGQILEATLSAGAHTITLTATDTNGATATASIQVSVEQASSTPASYDVFLPIILKNRP